MDQIITDYLQNAEAVLKAAAGEEKALKLAAQIIADAYAAGHKIYIFGCTHSAILAEDVFYRAGAPAFWRPLWGPGMSITTTPGFLTSAVEHSEEIGNEVIRCSQMAAGDVLGSRLDFRQERCAGRCRGLRIETRRETDHPDFLQLPESEGKPFRHPEPLGF